eukprot:3197880-Pleurochrysis_carterae.AAC.1
MGYAPLRCFKSLALCTKAFMSDSDCHNYHEYGLWPQASYPPPLSHDKRRKSPMRRLVARPKGITVKVV